MLEETTPKKVERLAAEDEGVFKSWGKIPRYTGTINVTEKIDGTNAQIHITSDGKVFTGSRNRWCTPDNDNYGFSTWVHDNIEEIKKLGVGRFYGEWWGEGIGRGYGIRGKCFTLFSGQKIAKLPDMMIQNNPFVPVIYRGKCPTGTIERVMQELWDKGSSVSPGFMRPEGIIIYHEDSRALYKKTFEKDEGKGE